MKPILLDVDAGVDDTLAIMYALLSPRLDVRAITTVAGNVPVGLCTRNVLLTLEILSPMLRAIPPVAQGSSKPLRRTLFTAKEVHGKDGIGGASRYYPRSGRRASAKNAVDTILNEVKRTPALTIVATGPLTNIALALKKDRAAMMRIREIVVMGGAFLGAHNTGPAAEFNFYVDPEAADCVMQSGLPVRLIPLNITEKCIVTPGDVRLIRDPSLRRYVQRVTKFYFDFHMRTEGFEGGYLHDPVAVAAVAEPSCLTAERGYVHVESGGVYTRGVSLFFPRLNPKREAQLPGWVNQALRKAPIVSVAYGIDSRRFKRLFLSTLQSGD